MKKILAYVLLGVSMLLGATGCSMWNSGDSDDDASITSFVFKAENNSSVLSYDIAGAIDQNAGTITVSLPKSLYTDTASRATLTADISYSGSSAKSGAVYDYSKSPVSVAAVSGGSEKVYLVQILQAHDTVSAGTLLFTEYYSGSTYSYKGTSNQYVEITNMSANTVDLGSVQLNRHAWKNGQRLSSEDQSVLLSGELAAGASLVVYSNLCGFTFSNGTAVSDRSLNSVITFSGQDALTLTSGTVLDALGPADGAGTGWSWGNTKLMERKSYVTAYSGWNEDEWITWKGTNKAADAANAGLTTTASTDTAKAITYFALEGLDSPVYGSIDASAKTVTFKLLDKYRTVLKPTVSTDGFSVRLANLNRIVSGETEIDFASISYTNPLTLYVFDKTGAKDDWKTVVLGETKYTTVNYDFDGGIQTVLDAVNSGTTSFDTDVTGILTCKDVYGSKTAQHCFFLQDKNAALYFFVYDNSTTLLPDDALIGNKITVHVTGGKVFSNMPEVTAISSAAVTDSATAAIYYETGSYANAAAEGKVYCYTGSVEAAADSHLVGTFSKTNDLYFHVASSLESTMAAGVSGTFYGPVTYSYSQYRMELSDEFQMKF